MEHPYPSVEFEADITGDGIIKIPKTLAQAFGAGKRVTVKLTDGIVSKTLRERNVTEEEIHHIAHLQLEQRENVIEFLNGEGMLSSNASFIKRAKAFKDSRK